MTQPDHQVIPLCVDLDGTFINNDITWGSVKKYLKEAGPLKKLGRLFFMAYWLVRGGRSCLKQALARTVPLVRGDIVLNEPMVRYILAEKAKGRPLYLATAADEVYAAQIVQWYNYWDGFFASNGVVNLRAHHKAKRLCNHFGGPSTFSSISLPLIKSKVIPILVIVSRNKTVAVSSAASAAISDISS